MSAARQRALVTTIALAAIVCVSCGSGPRRGGEATGSIGVSGGSDAGSGAIESATLQYDGSIRHLTSATSSLEISAPILPKISVLYGAEGSSYPVTQQALEALADAASLVFTDLITGCTTGGYPVKPPPALQSQRDLLANYEQIADCAYNLYTAKPYWIPQLVADVDICSRRLGPGWRMIRESDLAGITAAEYLAIDGVLPLVEEAADERWFAYYFTRQVFVIAANGAVAQGDLSPAALVRVAPLVSAGCGCAPTGESLKHHLEPGVALRCIRRSSP